jgi:hypothetical protein
MSKITNFITDLVNQIRNSIFNPSFYKELDHKETSYTIYYLLKLAAIISLVVTIGLLVTFNSFLNSVMTNSNTRSPGEVLSMYIETYFADDLVVTFRNGELITNKSEPIIFPIPFSWLNIDLQDNENIPGNIAVINTVNNFTPTLLDQYDTFFVMATSSAAYRDREVTKVLNYEDIEDKYPDLVINKNLVREKTRDVAYYINSAMPYIFIFGFILLFIFFVLAIVAGELIGAIFFGFLAYIVAKILNIQSTFGTWYLKAIRADTLFLVLSWTVGWIIPFTVIPFVNTFVVLLVLYFNNNFKK